MTHHGYIYFNNLELFATCVGESLLALSTVSWWVRNIFGLTVALCGKLSHFGNGDWGWCNLGIADHRPSAPTVKHLEVAIKPLEVL